MIEMSVRKPDALQRKAEMIERAHKPLHVAARIDERRMLRGRIPNQGAILLQWCHWNDPDVQLGRYFAHAGPCVSFRRAVQAPRRNCIGLWSNVTHLAVIRRWAPS